jgi:hypothetical protein
MTTLLDAALEMAAAGWAVIPLQTPVDGVCDCRKPDCSSPGKHPRTAHGLSDGTTDADQIRRWYAMWPQANIGALVPDGYVVVDVDVADLTTLFVAGELPATATERTGRGWHFVYRTFVPVGPKVAVRAHVDLRGPGSYIVVAPSLHANGRQYEWVTPLAQRVATAPDWVLQAAERKPQAAGADDGAPIPRGQRNDTLTRLAGAMRRQGMTIDEITIALKAVDVARCCPPLELEEPGSAGRIAASIGRYAPAEDPVDSRWPEPEDRGTATLSELGDVQYVEDLLRPGRIVVWAAEEGSGKSYAVDDELAIRVAVAGGSFAGTWPTLRTGPVLVLSEMHSDDDYQREATVLASLGLERSALLDLYYRLPLMTAAGGKPALTVPEWRERTTAWLHDHNALLLVVDTATNATQVDPWGVAIQSVYRDLRVMLAAYPALAVVLVVHCRKPSGRGDRRLSDVLGEWGRWCDVVVLQENDGASLTRTKISVRKRVSHERRIVATKAGGLLVDPHDLVAEGPKVGLDTVVDVIAGAPGMTIKGLAEVLKVAPSTAATYAQEAERSRRIERRRSGPKGQFRLYRVVTEVDGGTSSNPPSASGDGVGRFTDATTRSDPGSFRPSDDPIGSEGSRSEGDGSISKGDGLFGDQGGAETDLGERGRRPG